MTTRRELIEREYAELPTVQLSKTTELNSTVLQLSTIEAANPIDEALDKTADLITQAFKPWYAKQAYRLGVDRYIGLAKEARQIRNGSPAKVFSSSLKRAV